MSDRQIIAPERLGLWAAAAFALALVALVLAVVGIYRTNAVFYGTQIEVLALSKKIEMMKTGQPPAAAQDQAQAAPK